MNWKIVLALAAPAAIILVKLYGRRLGRKAAQEQHTDPGNHTHPIFGFDHAADKGKR